MKSLADTRAIAPCTGILESDNCSSYTTRSYMSTFIEERRSSIRHADFISDSLIVETTLESGTNRALNARLLDVSQGGLGIALTIPVAVGENVDVDGSLTRKGAFVLLRGRARVAHCVYQKGLPHYRVGLAFEELRCQTPEGAPAELFPTGT